MKVKRRTKLGQALDQIAETAQSIKSAGTAEIDGRGFNLDDEVLLEIEFERKKGEEELEFEIKWPGKREKVKEAEGGRGPLFWGLLVGALLGGGALANAIRKRRHEEQMM